MVGNVEVEAGHVRMRTLPDGLPTRNRRTSLTLFKRVPPQLEMEKAFVR